MPEIIGTKAKIDLIKAMLDNIERWEMCGEYDDEFCSLDFKNIANNRVQREIHKWLEVRKETGYF